MAADPQTPQSTSLIHELVVDEGVHGDVRGQVTGPVGNGQHLTSLPEAGQRAERRPRFDRMAVVDRNGQT